ncbi:hypothetical protein [Vibrio sinaloensis]|uniref:hypothetical protein n=1 Tax=Photobacterium sp. (strain ATCC 43367) TaxID=379097 RepID=UPI0022AEE797|nr:hypothetical protein [Vibrio sinaloensis]MCZ4294741.1 hypothetical protein [Vibrio sinaloensis]
MSLTVRLEKLRFILEEMELAHHLAKNASDDANARVLSRHVIIRAENLITHARSMRKPLQQAGYRVRDFHRTKETYASEFELYFSEARHKLGAHIQDFDFAKRIDLWNEVESIKVDYFANDALSIYEELESLSIPELISYNKPQEINDPNFNAELTVLRNMIIVRSGSELGTDPLAISRPNTTAMLNGTPVHIRAGQLNLLRRWIDYQLKLLKHLKHFKGVERILKGRILTDIVNFCDCLVTRKVSAGSPQGMDGLDRLLIESGESTHLITQFLQVYEFEKKINSMRDIRNKVGAHLEIDDTISLSVLLNKLDDFPFEKAIKFYRKVESLFCKVCSETFFLSIHLADGQYSPGVISNNPSVVPYGLSYAPSKDNLHIKKQYDCDEVYEKYYKKWKSCDLISKEEGRYYFWNAFVSATVIEDIRKEEVLHGGGIRYKQVKKRTSHDFILKKLLSASDVEILEYLLPLLSSCSTGDPSALTEVILEFSRESNRVVLTPAICSVVGELASWKEQEAKGYLDQNVRHSKSSWTKLIATLALFKMFIRTEGLDRINNRTHFESYELAIGWINSTLTNEQKLTINIVFLSQFYSQHLVNYIKPFEKEISNLKAELKKLLKGQLTSEVFSELEPTLEALLNTYDYVGITLMISDVLEGMRFREYLLHLVCNGIIATTNHDQARRHLVGCYLRNSNMDKALQLARKLADRNPGVVGYQITLTQILASIPKFKGEAKEIIQDIRTSYSCLNREEELMLGEVEDSLSGGNFK